MPEPLKIKPVLTEEQYELLGVHLFLYQKAPVPLTEVKAYCEIFQYPDVEYLALFLRILFLEIASD